MPTSMTGVSTVNVMLSDPATCSGPAGPFAHVYVTITDVQANISSTAGATDSGWTDLTPGLSSQPKQIDLLGQANNQCFLATLGDTQQLQAGNYQQIRLILAGNGVTVANNACTSSPNCVVLSADNSVHQLLLSSESTTGLKIPSGQIASGAFIIAAGQTKDLDIDFNTCESIVVEGNGQYRLKPVLHAGEVSTTSSSINGKVLDNATGNPVNGEVLVALEQKDSTGVDRIMMATLAGTDGSFVFCPVPTGTYDVVIVGERSDRFAYQPSIVTGVTSQRPDDCDGCLIFGGSGYIRCGGVFGRSNVTEQHKSGNCCRYSTERTRNGGQRYHLHHSAPSQCPAAIGHAFGRNSRVVQLSNRHRLCNVFDDAAGRRPVSRSIFRQWTFAVAKLRLGSICSGRLGFCSFFRGNRRLRFRRENTNLCVDFDRQFQRSRSDAGVHAVPITPHPAGQRGGGSGMPVNTTQEDGVCLMLLRFPASTPATRRFVRGCRVGPSCPTSRPSCPLQSAQSVPLAPGSLCRSAGFREIFPCACR